MTKPKSTPPPKEPDLPGAKAAMERLIATPKMTPFERYVQDGGNAQIGLALQQGYSYTDIAKILAEYDIPVSVKTLKAVRERSESPVPPAPPKSAITTAPHGLTPAVTIAPD